MNVATLVEPDAILAALASDKLLAILLTATPVASAELERVLTDARLKLLRHLDAARHRCFPSLARSRSSAF